MKTVIALAKYLLNHPDPRVAFFSMYFFYCALPMAWMPLMSDEGFGTTPGGALGAYLMIQSLFFGVVFFFFILNFNLFGKWNKSSQEKIDELKKLREVLKLDKLEDK